MRTKNPLSTACTRAAAGPRVDRGTSAEREAENHLRQQGLTLQQRNFRCKAGEIDLIMRDGQVYVFVEVRYRKHDRFGSPAETVGYLKQKKLWRTAQYFLQTKHLVDKAVCRFDVVTITGTSPPAINWIENAFSQTC